VNTTSSSASTSTLPTTDADLLAFASTHPRAPRDPVAILRELERRQLSVTRVQGVEPLLAIRGRLPTSLSVAIVGARATDPYGRVLSRALGRAVARCGLAVVSGGAEGCDHEAHEGCLEVGGRTIVVLPAGHDHAYPKHHADLFERACQNGAVVSSVWPTVPLARHRFLARNRVIAELAAVTIVVRAEARSGSLSTAAAAKSLGKPLGAVPGAVGEALSEGVHRLLEDGATAIASPRGLMRWLDRVGVSVIRSGERWPMRCLGQAAPWSEASEHETGETASEPLDDEARKVLEVIVAEPGLDLDAIAVRSGLPLGELTQHLLSLELFGALERMPGGRYRSTGRGE